MQVRGQHFRAGSEALDEECAKQDCGAQTARNTEGDRWNKDSSFYSVISRFRSYYPADVSLAELRTVLGAGHSVAVRDPVYDPGAQAGQQPDIGADRAATNNQPPIFPCISHPIQDTATDQVIFRYLRY